MAWRVAFSSDGLHGGVDGTTILVAEHDNQAGAQNIDPVLNASETFNVEHIARDSNDEQIAEAFIKDEFGWYTRIRTTENDGKRVLALRQFCSSFGSLLARQSERNRASIFIAIFSHVRSVIS